MLTGLKSGFRGFFVKMWFGIGLFLFSFCLLFTAKLSDWMNRQSTNMVQMTEQTREQDEVLIYKDWTEKKNLCSVTFVA